MCQIWNVIGQTVERKRSAAVAASAVWMVNTPKMGTAWMRVHTGKGMKLARPAVTSPK